MNKTKESSLFFEELKKQRISQDIELNEISNRTKINLEYLESIEQGDFDFLPYIYVRLFLKAYCIEIGLDYNDSLKNLDKAMNIQQVKVKKEHPKINISTSSKSKPIKQIDLNTFNFSDFKKKNLANIFILFIIIIFGIWIARNISNNDTNDSFTTENINNEKRTKPISNTIKPNRITDSFLISNFLERKNISILDLVSPFELSLNSSENISIELSIDYTDSPFLDILNPKNEIIKSFDKNFFLRLEKTKGIEIKINNNLIDIVKSNNPKDLIYNTTSKELIIVTYLRR
ncbi:MAG: hypothetical protein CMG48_02685 [Candidatus Marinimicrobia bacterium]|nr:hypothetical protein [Candidatus Neomarinimicrobiota bacterium]